MRAVISMQMREVAVSRRIGSNLSQCTIRERSVRPRSLLSLTRAAGSEVSIPESSMTAYESCVGELTSRGMADADAEKAVRQAFGYSSQLYWRQEKVAAKLDPDTVAIALDFLENQLSLAVDADKLEVVKKFPEVLTIDPALMSSNVAKLTDRFKMKGTMLANSIKRKPRVLGATTDCEGDCAGDCTRCFAQF